MRLRFVFLLLITAFAWAPDASAERDWIAGGPVPSRYEISIEPDVAAGAFRGEARINVRATEAVAAITLNALDLTIESATIDGVAARTSTNESAQTLTLTPRARLAAGDHVIRIVYRGKIYDDAYGLFRVTYDADGQSRTMLNTMFEPGDARRLAPMWDQPDKRAVFALTVTAPAGQSAYANMPIAETTQLASGRTRVRFQETPPMASYLLFFAIGDLERIHMDVDGVDLGVVARRGSAEQGRYALEAGASVLRYYNDYFGIRYPLPKLDMVATPGAGSFGAMENWGAILYFDQYLLLDASASEETRQGVFSTVAHEIAHQWFGDLVTMRWWDDLWLNEGFATWMEGKATEELHPDWQPWLAQLSGGRSEAMSLDARAGGHPLVQEVNTLDEANLAFNTITYQKGQAVIRMIETYVGEDHFRDGVRAYLNGHLYGNTQGEDLWSAIQAASGQPVLDIARDFTTQVGFPVLTTSVSACTRNRSDDHISVTQRRFALDDASRTDELWTAPVVVQALGGEPASAVLPRQRDGAISASACSAYVVNAGQTGYFRVLYDQRGFDALSEHFAHLPDADQLGLLLDYWAFGRSGDASFARYLDLASRVPADADSVIVSDTVTSMGALVDYERGRPGEAAVRTYARERLAPFFARVGWTPRAGEPSNEALLRAALITTLGELGDEGIAAEARRRVNGDAALLPAGIRDAALGVYGANATAAEYDGLVAHATAASDFIEQRRLWLALAGARDEALARRTLDLTLGDNIPRQLRFGVLSAVAAEHPRLAWDFLVAHRAQMEAMMDVVLRVDVPTGIAELSSDPAMLAEIDAYAATAPEGARENFDAAKAAVQVRIDTAARMGAVEEWIAAQSARR